MRLAITVFAADSATQWNWAIHSAQWPASHRRREEQIEPLLN
jgi:hypothetical protein